MYKDTYYVYVYIYRCMYMYMNIPTSIYINMYI